MINSSETPSLTRHGVLIEEGGDGGLTWSRWKRMRRLSPLQSAACTYRIALGRRAGQKVNIRASLKRRINCPAASERVIYLWIDSGDLRTVEKESSHEPFPVEGKGINIVFECFRCTGPGKTIINNDNTRISANIPSTALVEISKYLFIHKE